MYYEESKGGDEEAKERDEVEDLYQLIVKVKEAYP
jgi:hypothetical protein